MTYPQLVTSTTNNLVELKLVHMNESGVVLTRKGLKFTEDELLT